MLIYFIWNCLFFSIYYDYERNEWVSCLLIRNEWVEGSAIFKILWIHVLSKLIHFLLMSMKPIPSSFETVWQLCQLFFIVSALFEHSTSNHCEAINHRLLQIYNIWLAGFNVQYQVNILLIVKSCEHILNRFVFSECLVDCGC